MRSSKLPTAASTVNGIVANGNGQHPTNLSLKPRTAAEYAATVSGFMNLTTSFDSGIDVMGSTTYI